MSKTSTYNNINNDNTMYSTTTTASSKYNNLPKFCNPNQQQRQQDHRYVSNDSSDHNLQHLSSINSSVPFNRTISSSSSIISTPSNNIRRFQKQQENDKEKKSIESTTSRTSRNGRSIKTKLLNLHQSQKHQVKNHNEKSQQPQTNSKINTHSFIDQLHETNLPSLSFTKNILKSKQSQPKTRVSIKLGDTDLSSKYDYSVYTRATSEINDLPFVKSSQINAWESAERTSYMIFNNDSTDDEEDDDEKTREFDSDLRKHAIKSIPGYSDSELELLFNHKNHNSSNEEERNLIIQNNKHHINQSALLTQRHLQRKEILSKIFGHNINVNNRPSIDNSLYSINEDCNDEEINLMLHLDAEFKINQEDTKKNLIKKYKSIQNYDIDDEIRANNDDVENKMFEDFDYERFSKLTYNKMNKLITTHIKKHEERSNGSYLSEEENSIDDEDVNFNQELLQFTISFLKQCVKKETLTDNDEMSM